jgi:hypothetical protein
MTISRRGLLVAGVSTIAMIGCTTTPTVSTIVSDTALVENGVATAVAFLQTLPTLAGSLTLATITKDLAEVESATTAIASVATTSTGLLAQQIASAVAEFAPIALSFIPGGSVVIGIVNAVVSLIPGILAFAGVAGAPFKAPEKATLMSPDEARSKLAALPKIS